MLEEITNAITSDVMRKRLDFSRKAAELLEQHRNILHPSDFYGAGGFETISNLERYKFREIDSFVPGLAKEEMRAIVMKLRGQIKTDGETHG